MKICYLSSARIPTERPHAYAIAKMCEAFGHLGHVVTLLSPRKTSWMGDDIYGYYKLEKVFSHQRVATLDLLMSRLDGRVGFWVDFLSFVVSVLMMHRGLVKTSDILYTRESYVAFFLPRRKTVLELHTLPARSWFMKRLLLSVRRLSVISHGLAEDVRAYTGRTDILVVPDAVDIERFSHLPEKTAARVELGIAPNKAVAVYTGNFYVWKGVDVLAQASALLSDMEVVLVGGTDEVDYQRVAEHAHTNPSLIVRRFERPERMPLYLAAADVVVIPNIKGTAISERHTSPLKLFEYMAAGKPIVASNISSLREVLDDTTAVWCEPGNPESLAMAIRSAVDPAVGRCRAIAAREKVRVYSWDERARTAISNV